MKTKVFVVGMALAGSGMLSGCAGHRLPASGVVAAPARGTKYALLVGISHYRGPVSSFVPSAASDAQKTGDVLRELAGFSTSNTTVLTDASGEKPTRRNILKRIEQLSRKLKPADTVFVYFGGHGFSRSGRDYFIPWDADWRSQEAAQASSLPTSLLLARLNQLPAGTLITAFESCRHESWSNDGSAQAQPRAEQALAQQVLAPKPRVSATIYSCRPGENTYATVGNKEGCLSRYLRRGLQGAAANANGDVTIAGLSSYLTKAVFGYARLSYGVRQQPVTIVHPTSSAHPEETIVCSGLPPGDGGSRAQPFRSPRSTDQKYRNQMQSAYEALLQGDKPAAERAFEAALRVDPESQRAVGEMAALCERRGDRLGAQKWYRRFAQLLPRDPGSLNRQGEAAVARGDAEQAEACFQGALALSGRWPVPMKNLGLVYLQRRQYPLAEYWFKRAYTSAPDWPEPLLYLAWLKAFRKQNAEAGRLYTKLIEAFPKWPRALVEAARFYHFGLKDLSRAEQIYRRAIDVEPRQGGHYANLADCLLDQNRRDEALSLARRAIQLGYKANHRAYWRLHIQPGAAKRSSVPQAGSST